MRIYLDHNATTPVRREVLEAMFDCLRDLPGNPSSAHREGQAARAAREEARGRIAAAAGCAPRSVVFCSGGTEADNLALWGALAARPERRHVVTAATEHEAILQTVEALERAGHPVTVLPVDPSGRVAPEAVAAALTPETAIVSVMAANNETGALADLEALGRVCRERQVWFHSDAVQYFGKVPFAFDDLPLDLASVSGHKIGGPKGIGALLVRPGLRLEPRQTGGAQEGALRPGTENLPGIVGFGTAAELATAELPNVTARWESLREHLEAGLRRAVPDLVVNAQGVPRLPNTSNLSFPGLDGESLLIALDLEGIAVSTGAACNAGAAEPSHVLLAMGASTEHAASSLRFSLGSHTTKSEIEEVLNVLPTIVRRLAETAPAS